MEFHFSLAFCPRTVFTSTCWKHFPVIPKDFLSLEESKASPTNFTHYAVFRLDLYSTSSTPLLLSSRVRSLVLSLCYLIFCPPNQIHLLLLNTQNSLLRPHSNSTPCLTATENSPLKHFSILITDSSVSLSRLISLSFFYLRMVWEYYQ